MRRPVLALLCLLAAGCSRHHGEPVSTPQPGAAGAPQQSLPDELHGARSGTVIAIPPGMRTLDGPLTVPNGVTLRGAGTERTTLSFKSANGPAGVRVLGRDATVEALTIADSKGDALTVEGGQHIIIRGVRASWSGAPSSGNGAYGIHVRSSTDILVEDCAVSSASGAGIYLEQARNAVVRRCHVEQNVAGIVLGNTVGADVQNNIATGNSAGIVVASLADLTPPAQSVRLFTNRVYKNNLGNFAAAGTPFAAVPAGSGIVVSSASQVEIFDNDIADNQTANILIAANFFKPAADPAAAVLWPRAISIYDNRFSGGGGGPLDANLKALKLVKFGPQGRLPDVVWDGYRSGAAGQICLQNGNAAVLDADLPHAYRQPAPATGRFHCQLPKLPPVVLRGR